VLIVGRGDRELAAALAADGLEVREAADPDPLSALLPLLEDVSIVCWLATARDERLASLLDKLVDTPVRGFVYESTGAVPQAVRDAERRRIPVEVIGNDDADWLAAVRRLLF